jgi:hypothetical protein
MFHYGVLGRNVSLTLAVGILRFAFKVTDGLQARISKHEVFAGLANCG